MSENEWNKERIKQLERQVATPCERCGHVAGTSVPYLTWERDDLVRSLYRQLEALKTEDLDTQRQQIHVLTVDLERAWKRIRELEERAIPPPRPVVDASIVKWAAWWADYLKPVIENDNAWYSKQWLDGKDAGEIGEILAAFAAAFPDPDGGQE